MTDKGIGISENELEYIFSEFFQGSSSEQTRKKGKGLGLAICKRIIDKHQGQLLVKSKLNEGSEFYFSLPL